MHHPRESGKMVSMAVVTREYTDENGRQLVEYESGIIKEKGTGYMVKPKPVFTSDNAAAMVARRVAKSERAMRDAILATTQAHADEIAKRESKLPVKLSGSSQAVGIAAGVLWEKVLNPGKNDRLIDQVRTFESLTKTAKLVDDPKAPASVTNEQAAALGGIGAAALLAAMAEIERRKGA